MRVKITVGVVGDGVIITPLEVDRIMRGCLNGVLEKYRGRVDIIQDSYSGCDSNWYGQTTKSKMMTIANEEEKKVEG